MNVLLYEMEIDGLKMVNECKFITDICSINDSIFMESETNEDSVIRKIIESVKNFFKNVKEKLKTMFGDKVGANAKKVSSIVGNTKIKNEKINIRDWKKLKELREKTKQNVKNAKTEEEVNSVMDFYHKNKSKIFATACIAMTVSGALMLLSNRKSDTDIGKMEQEAESSLISIEKQFLKNPADDEIDAKTVKIRRSLRNKATALSELFNDDAQDWAGEMTDLTRGIKEKTGADVVITLSNEDLKNIANKIMGHGIK